MESKTSHILLAMDAFIEGTRRGTEFSKEIEGMFAELYDDDERFENLQYALAMFGAGTSIEEDEKILIKEFKHAKSIICQSNS